MPFPRLPARLLRRFLAVVALIFLFGDPSGAEERGRPDEFSGSITRDQLDHVLSRAVTHAGLCVSHPDPTTDFFEDDLRMLQALNVRFVGRAAFAWHLPPDEEAHFSRCREAAKRIHDTMPSVLLQGCVFEIVTTEVGRIPVPSWVFAAFDRPVEARTFDYEAMLYPDGRFRDHWQPGASVPDMSRLETRLWFYYRACRYIECGMEAIHFGQVHLMDDRDLEHVAWQELLDRVRAFGAAKARRQVVLCDAHTHGVRRDGILLFDFHSYPLRIREVKEEPMAGKLSAGEAGDLVGNSLGGRTVHGWTCEALPYLVEFDNYGYSGRGGESVGGIWVWGYDEISWFARLPSAEQGRWLAEAHRWLAERDPTGHLQMPSRRMLAAPLDGRKMYHANRAGPQCPPGFGVEDAIRSVWRVAEN